MLNLARRNLEIYFKSKATVFFSLMGTLIIFVLYILFLGNLWQEMYSEEVNRFMIDKWAMAGILSVVSMTSSAGTLSIMVGDKTGAIHKDFYASPVPSYVIAGGYILATTAIGLIMSFISFVLSELFIFVRGGELFSVAEMIHILLVLVVVSLSNSSIMILFASFFKNHEAFTSTVGIVNTIAGFVAGAYIPIGMFPRPMQIVMQILPIYQGSVLLRDSMLREEMESLGMSSDKLMGTFTSLGVKIQWGDTVQPIIVSYAVIVIACFVSITVAAFNLFKRDE